MSLTGYLLTALIFLGSLLWAVVYGRPSRDKP